MRKYLVLLAVACGLIIPVAAVSADWANSDTSLVGTGDACTPGAWYHFVNNQTGKDAAPGSLTATFSNPADTETVGPTAVNQSVQHFYVFNSGTLTGASTNLPGRLVLSHISCGKKTDDPTTLPEIEE